MHSNDLEACGMKLCCFWFHSDVKFMTRSLYSGERQWPTWASCSFPFQPLHGIWRNLTGSKYLMSQTKFLCFGLVCLQWWLPWPQIGWDILNFSFATPEQNLMKLHTKQVLYQICIFLANLPTKFANGNDVMQTKVSTTFSPFTLADWSYQDEEPFRMISGEYEELLTLIEDSADQYLGSLKRSGDLSYQSFTDLTPDMTRFLLKQKEKNVKVDGNPNRSEDGAGETIGIV